MMAGAHVVVRRRVTGRASGSAWWARPWVLATGLGVLVLFCVIVVGGYSLHWRWTGLSDSVTLWDWLQVLALPIALGAVPILMRHRSRLHRRHRHALAAGAGAFVGLVLAGYLVPMGWTGFTGNTLWDWLELLLLPAVVASASVWATTWPPARPHLFAVGVAILTLAVLAVFGYTVPWRWTGFAGNTAWDWIKLLLLPVIVPVALLPPVTRYLADRLAPPHEE